MEWCSYFRCRDGQVFTALTSAIQHEAEGYTPYAPATLSVSGAVSITVAAYYRLSFPQEPPWLSLLSAITGSALAHGIPGRGHSAVLLVAHAGHHYVLTYGTAQSIAKKLRIERRFGKTVVSNGKEQDEVRAIKAKVHGPTGKVRIERRGHPGPLRELEVPRRANMAAGLSAKVMLGVDHVASGDTAIRTSGPTDLADLVAKLDQLEVWWNGGVETDQGLAALDRIVEIRDEGVIAQLDQLRETDIANDQPHRFSLCLDDEELWDATDLAYFVNRERLELQTPDEVTIFTALHAASLAHASPLQVRFEATVPTRTSAVRGLLADNLAYEGALPGDPSVYVFEDSGWFRVSSSWRQQVASDIGALVTQSAALLSTIHLPTALSGSEREDEYLERLMASPGIAGRCEPMHLQFPPSQPQVELCDACCDGNVLMFLKRGSDRTACGDVAQQAMDSANALTDMDGTFRQWANSMLSARGWHLDMQQRAQIVFCLVLITANASRQPTAYSVRAMDALSNHLREIERLGFRAAVAVV